MVIYDLSNGSIVLLLAVNMGLGGANVAIIGVFMVILSIIMFCNGGNGRLCTENHGKREDLASENQH